ncbi:hypothetical protein ES703_61353 [subsurface metagenome]
MSSPSTVGSAGSISSPSAVYLFSDMTSGNIPSLVIGRRALTTLNLGFFSSGTVDGFSTSGSSIGSGSAAVGVIVYCISSKLLGINRPATLLPEYMTAGLSDSLNLSLKLGICFLR